MAILSNVQEERDITFLVNPEARFVSLVQRGANQTPFRIVKTQRGKDMKVLQKLIVPKGMEVEKIQKAFDENAGSLLTFENGMAAGTHDVYEQYPIEKCEKDSFELVTLSDELGISAIQATPVEAESNLITKMFRKAPKIAQVIKMEDVPEASEEVQKSFLMEGLYDETYKLGDAIIAIMGQQMGDPAKKLTAVKTVMNNYTAYLEDVLRVAKEDVVLTPKEESKAETEVEIETEEVSKEETVEAEAGAEVETEEVAGEELPDTSEAQTEQFDVEAVVAKAVEASTQPLKEMQEVITKLSETLTVLDGRVSKMQKVLPVTLESSESDPEPVNKSDKSDTDSEENVFAGVFGQLR